MIAPLILQGLGALKAEPDPNPLRIRVPLPKNKTFPLDLLAGIKIIDFTRLLPGPLATHLLAQMGAEVIKIESPKRMDYVRYQGMQVDEASYLFHQLNHNKTLQIIDYNQAKGYEELIDLIKQADVLIEQFRPGAMEAWSLDFSSLQKINPQLVYVSITGYGQDSSYQSEAGHDLNYLAYSGILSLLKDEKGKPIVPDTQFADIGGAYMAIMALQGALIKKLKTGKGSYVDVSLADAMAPFLTLPHSLHSSGLDHRVFNLINGNTTVNYSIYQCADGKYIAVAALEIKFWNNICETIHKPEWKREGEFELLLSNFPKKEVEALFLSKNRDEWAQLFKGKDVCVAPILEVEELEAHEYHQEQGTFQSFQTPDGTELKAIGLPFKLKEI